MWLFASLIFIASLRQPSGQHKFTRQVSRAAFLTSLEALSSQNVRHVKGFLSVVRNSGFELDLHSCTKAQHQQLLGDFGEVVLHDPTFSHISLAKYSAVLSHHVYCDDGTLIPLLVSDLVINNFRLAHLVVISHLLSVQLLGHETYLDTVKKERYLLKSLRAKKIFLSRVDLSRARKLAGKIGALTFYSFAGLSREHIPALLSSNTGDELGVKLIMDRELSHKSLASSKRSGFQFECDGCADIKYCELQCVAASDAVVLAPDLSIYCSLLGGDTEIQFIHGYVDEIVNQGALNSVELLVASSDETALDALRIRLQRAVNEKGIGFHLAVRTIRIRVDIGLYESWDLLIKKYASGEFLTNWNVDDRKHRFSLALKLWALKSMTDVDVISSSVFKSDISGEDWHGCINGSMIDFRSCEEWFNFVGTYSLSSLVSTDSLTGELLGSMNFPHNAPVYRRTVHDRYGFFSSPLVSSDETLSSPAPTCYDWRFWVNVARYGGRFYHLDFPGEGYFMRSNSHERRDKTKAKECVQSVLESVRDLGLYNNDMFWQGKGVLRYLWQRNVIIFEPTGANDLFMNSAKEWLANNGHNLVMFSLIHYPHCESLTSAAFDAALFFPFADDFPTSARCLRESGVRLIGLKTKREVYQGCGGVHCDAQVVWQQTSLSWEFLNPLINTLIQ